MSDYEYRFRLLRLAIIPIAVSWFGLGVVLGMAVSR